MRNFMEIGLVDANSRYNLKNRHGTMIQPSEFTQIKRTWSRDLVTPPKVFLIGSINHTLGLGLLTTCM